jgi:hypothetical protein
MRKVETCQFFCWPVTSRQHSGPNNHKWHHQQRPPREKKCAYVTLQTWMAIITTLVAIALFSIESRLYRDIHRSNQAEVETVRQTRHKNVEQQFNKTRDNYSRTNMLTDGNTPVTRVGMVERKLLRTMKVVSTDWDLLLMEQMEMDSVKRNTKSQANYPWSETNSTQTPRVVFLGGNFKNNPRSSHQQSPSVRVEPVGKEFLFNDHDADFYIRDFGAMRAYLTTTSPSNLQFTS